MNNLGVDHDSAMAGNAVQKVITCWPCSEEHILLYFQRLQLNHTRECGTEMYLIVTSLQLILYTQGEHCYKQPAEQQTCSHRRITEEQKVPDVM